MFPTDWILAGSRARRCTLAVALALACSATARAQTQPPQNPVPQPPETRKTQPTTVPRPPVAQKQGASPDTGEQPSTTFKVSVKLVNVFTTVTDGNGTPISSLKQEDFQVFEDGRPQKIAVFRRESELPLSIVIAIDTSLSTRVDQKLELESARRFAHAILRPIDAISLFQFSEIVDQITPFTSDAQGHRQGHQPRSLGSRNRSV